MASFSTIAFTPATGRVFATKATKSSAPVVKEEKGFWDFIVGSIVKEDQVLIETNPILKKVEGEEKSNERPKTRNGKQNSVSVPPPKKSGGFGGFGSIFAKK